MFGQYFHAFVDIYISINELSLCLPVNDFTILFIALVLPLFFFATKKKFAWTLSNKHDPLIFHSGTCSTFKGTTISLLIVSSYHLIYSYKLYNFFCFQFLYRTNSRWTTRYPDLLTSSTPVFQYFKVVSPMYKFINFPIGIQRWCWRAHVGPIISFTSEKYK